MATSTRAWGENRILRRALIASLGVHALIALFLPTWMPAQSAGPQPIEALSFARVIRVQTQRPAPAVRPAAVPEKAQRARKISFARHRSELTANTRRPHARPTSINGPLGPVAKAPRHSAAHRPAPLYAQASASSMPLASTQSNAVRTPQPEATIEARSVDTSGVADRGGVLPLGAVQDPVLDPGVRAQLSKARKRSRNADRHRW